MSTLRHQITYDQIEYFRPRAIIAKNGVKELGLSADIRGGRLFYYVSIAGKESGFGDDVQAAIEVYNSIDEYKVTG